jgi:hypothetical protein
MHRTIKTDQPESKNMVSIHPTQISFPQWNEHIHPTEQGSFISCLIVQDDFSIVIPSWEYEQWVTLLRCLNENKSFGDGKYDILPFSADKSDSETTLLQELGKPELKSSEDTPYYIRYYTGPKTKQTHYLPVSRAELTEAVKHVLKIAGSIIEANSDQSIDEFYNCNTIPDDYEEYDNSNHDRLPHPMAEDEIVQQPDSLEITPPDSQKSTTPESSKIEVDTLLDKKTIPDHISEILEETSPETIPSEHTLEGNPYQEFESPNGQDQENTPSSEELTEQQQERVNELIEKTEKKINESDDEITIDEELEEEGY